VGPILFRSGVLGLTVGQQRMRMLNLPEFSAFLPLRPFADLMDGSSNPS
jgi:hypothetical protein